MDSNKQLVDVNEALKIAVEGIRCGWFTEEAYDAVAALLGETPTVDAVEVEHGEWIPTKYMIPSVMCSECSYTVGKEYEMEFKYCPNCGTKMEAAQ